MRGFSAEAQFKRETWFKTVIVLLRQAFDTRLYLRIMLLEMAFRNGLCKLSMPADIDESEIILSHRRRLIEEKLLILTKGFMSCKLFIKTSTIVASDTASKAQSKYTHIFSSASIIRHSCCL